MYLIDYDFYCRAEAKKKVVLKNFAKFTGVAGLRANWGLLKPLELLPGIQSVKILFISVYIQWHSNGNLFKTFIGYEESIKKDKLFLVEYDKNIEAQIC